MKLTKKDVTLVKRSIKHWDKDIIEKLKAGAKIFSSVYNYWTMDGVNTKGVVPDYGEHCPLCVVYAKKDGSCSGCPYLEFYGHCCDDIEGHWREYTINPYLETAKDMRNALAKIIGEEEI
jgi:hypothetical protein